MGRETTDKVALEEGEAFRPAYNADGLVAAICTDATSGEILMVAWMNEAALALSIETGVAHFWSRSRDRMWRKGEESGNTLRIREILTDCDQDTLWLKVEVEGDGVACHTGRVSCFYRRLKATDPGDPKSVVLEKL